MRTVEIDGVNIEVMPVDELSLPGMMVASIYISQIVVNMNDANWADVEDAVIKLASLCTKDEIQPGTLAQVNPHDLKRLFEVIINGSE